ncbi:MAG: hypothetical protein DRJ05_17850, partial [Bacteroidetes bacterium]
KMIFTSLHFQAHLQFTHPTPNSKIAKEPSNPSRKDIRKQSENINTYEGKIKGQQVTMAYTAYRKSV